jgi:hypothetical protein
MISRWRSGLARMACRPAISASRSAELVEDPLPLERGQPAQLHVQDRAGLQVVDVEQAHQALAGRVGDSEARMSAMTASSWSSALA